MEIEKSLNKDAVAGRGDSGTSSRGFGTLLSWLSDHETPVFTIGTSNKFTELPPELIRRGRFDELWWIDLPNFEDRVEIISVILKKYKRDPKKFKIEEISNATNGYTGAEIEILITSAMFTSFSKGVEITTKAITAETANIIPQSSINSAELEEMRNQAKDKLRPAQGVEPPTEIPDKLRQITI